MDGLCVMASVMANEVESPSTQLLTVITSFDRPFFRPPKEKSIITSGLIDGDKDSRLEIQDSIYATDLMETGTRLVVGGELNHR